MTIVARQRIQLTAESSTYIKRIAFGTCMALLCATACLLSAAPAGADTTQAKPYLMGVFPHLPPRELEKVYAPIAEQFSLAIGRPVQVGSSSSYEKFMENLDAQQYDIVFVQPFDYVRIADALGYRPLATRDEPLSTIIVTDKKSSIENLDDLRGKRMAMPPNVAAVSVLARRYLEKNDFEIGRDIVISHHRSHVSCLQQVLIGAADVCATAHPALRFFEHKMSTEMKIIVETQSIPHTLFATHPRVSVKEHNAIMGEILSWPQRAKGREILERGQMKPFVQIKDSDYDIVRKLERRIK